ncbi:hypothetical protein FV232_09750 [Methylobacterium sp. WL30]|nr:hypothetical protein FV225_03070 [Methylobacterium sp. WL93]TXN68168.1 hypothetical protein FV232_09750 [Methylobacterium sp. WL30]
MKTDDLNRAGDVLDRLEADGFAVLPMMRRGMAEKFTEAVRTGDWRGISDWDWKAWSRAVHAGYISRDTVSEKSSVMGNVFALTPAGEDAIRRFVDAVDLTQAAVSAGSDALEQAIEADEGRYVYAVSGRDHAVDPRALAVRDLIEANRLYAMAVATLGLEAADLILQHMPMPDVGAAA